MITKNAAAKPHSVKNVHVILTKFTLTKSGVNRGCDYFFYSECQKIQKKKNQTVISHNFF
jgi:hypothetical protein